MVPYDELEDLPRDGRLRRRILIGTIALAVVVAIAATLTRGGGPGSEGEGRVPDFSLPLLVGDGTISSDELRGKPVVLNFWASWCIPCREEAALLEEKWREYRDRVTFVGVNLRDEPADARAFVKKYGMTYPVVRDAEQTLARAIGLVGLPQTFFITSEWLYAGRTAGPAVGSSNQTQWLGAIEAEELEAQLQALVNDQ